MARFTRRQLLFGTLGAVGALAVPRTGRAQSHQAISADLVRFGWATDVGVPTPFQISPAGPGGAMLLSFIYDTLTWKSQDSIIPWLATEWSISEDGLSYTFSIADGITWHDGAPLTAGDVAFSFSHYADHPFLWMSTEVVASAEASNDQDVTIALKRPYAPFLEDIAGIVPIVPAHIWSSVEDPAAYEGADRSIGSGPFVLAEHDVTEAAYRLTANDAYWRGAPTVREWRQLTIPAASQIQALEQGDVDLVNSTDATVESLYADHAEIAVFPTAPLSIVRLAVNTGRAPLDDRTVRQAIIYALDRQLIAETITRGAAIVGSAGVIPPETPWHSSAVRNYPFDPDEARVLLGGREIAISIIADASNREPELIAPMLADVGITLTIQPVDGPTRLQLLDTGDFDLAQVQHIGIGGDPDYLRRWYAGEESNAYARGSIFDNAEYNELGEAQAAELDPERRFEIVAQMQAILADELPTIPLYYRRFYWLHRPALFAPYPTWGGVMNGIPFPTNKLAVLPT